MKQAARFLLCMGAMVLAACGPNTNLASSNGSSVVNNSGISSGTQTGSTTGSGGSITLGSSGSGANANNTSGTGATTGTGSSAMGTVSVTGTIGGSSFVAQDAVFGVGQDPDSNIVFLTVVISDQNNLCAFLQAGEGAANLIIANVASTNPNSYPTANTYVVVDPNGSIPDAVSNNSAYSLVRIAAIGSSFGTYANNGEIDVTTTTTAVTSPETMSITATDATQDTVQGTLTPAYCSWLNGISAQVKRFPTIAGLH